MFQNLKGNRVIILDLGEDGAMLSEATVSDVSQPHPKDAQPSQVLQSMMFGQQQELVVDLIVSTQTGQRTFRNVPATAVVDKGGATVIAESMDLMDVEIQALQKISDEHIAKNPWHMKVRDQLVEIRKKTSPKFAHEQERDETIENLKNQYGELKEQNTEIQKTQRQILEALTKLQSPSKQ